MKPDLLMGEDASTTDYCSTFNVSQPVISPAIKERVGLLEMLSSSFGNGPSACPYMPTNHQWGIDDGLGKLANTKYNATGQAFVMLADCGYRFEHIDPLVLGRLHDKRVINGLSLMAMLRGKYVAANL